MRLLVVDDAPCMLKAFRDILEASEYEVFEATNGEEALAVYSEVKPDIVLMDILMPKLDGVTATKKILERDPSAKIIVVSAMGKSGLEKECMEAGVKDFILKPFTIQELLASIKSLARG